MCKHAGIRNGALALLLSGSLVASLTPPFPARASADTTAPAATAGSTVSSSDDEDDQQASASDAVLTRDSDGFFAALSSDGAGTFKSGIGLSDLEKLGIYVSAADAAADGVTDTHVTQTGAGSFVSPAVSGSTDGASISYSELCTITVDQSVFDRGARLRYVNNNGASVSYNKRDCVQAVLYAISRTTQDPDFDGTTMYRVHVDYDGIVDLTNTVFVYSNTWLQLNPGTVMKKQFQDKRVNSTLADRDDAVDREIGSTAENILRNTANEFRQGGYAQCENIVIDGGTWDANLENYNRAVLGDSYQASLTKFSHMKNLVVQNTTFRGANLAHHLELAGIRDVTVTGSTFTGYDGATDKEAIQVETLHSKGSTRECEPFDDTPTRDIVVYDNSFADCCRGIGNHAYVLGLDATRIFVYRNSFSNLSAQAVLTTGCRDMRIEDNAMTNVGTGVDVRVTKYDRSTNVSMPVYENWTYGELVDNGFLNRNIKIIGNTIAATGSSTLNATDCPGVAISVKGQTITASSTSAVRDAAGSYAITGVTVKNNLVTAAVGTAVRFYNTKDCTYTGNTVQAVTGYADRGLGLYATKTTGLTVKNSSFANVASRGAYLLDSKNVTLSGCTFAGAGEAGVHVNGTTGLTVKKCAISGTGGYGVYLANASDAAKLTGNSISMAKKRAGLYATGTVSGTKATNNTILTSAATAIRLGSAKTPGFTVSKKTRKKITGKTGKRASVSAYAGTGKAGSVRAAANGAFALKFGKKQPKRAVVQLRYKDASKNSIRTDVAL